MHCVAKLATKPAGVNVQRGGASPAEKGAADYANKLRKARERDKMETRERAEEEGGRQRRSQLRTTRSTRSH